MMVQKTDSTEKPGFLARWKEEPQRHKDHKEKKKSLCPLCFCGSSSLLLKNLVAGIMINRLNDLEFRPFSMSNYKPNLYFLELIVGAGFSRSKARKIYDSLLTHIMNALAEEESVKFMGFGSFQVRKRKARAAPGQPPLPADSPPQKVIQFRPSRALKLFIAQFAGLQTQEEAAAEPEIVQAELAPQDGEQRQSQFDFHYNIGIAYKEMSLYEQAIKELESALNLVESSDEEHRFVHCCSLLATCYSATGNFTEAEKWLLEGLQASSVTGNEYKALRYELGLLYETSGKLEKASEAFFDVYSIDPDFRRVGQKIKTLQMPYINPQSPKRSERRKQLIPVVLRGCDSFGNRFQEETLIVNISRQGAGLRTSHTLKPGSLLELYFTSVQRVKVARVIWCAPESNTEGGYRAGVLVYNQPPKS
jgi:nucleoid DNA-binding protein